MAGKDTKIAIPEGLCRCGCGQTTRIATRNRYDLGHFKGRPLPFVNGHNRRGKRAEVRWREEDCGAGTPCWIWAGRIEPNGYGKGTAPSGGMGWAHRIVYEERIGP